MGSGDEDLIKEGDFAIIYFPRKEIRYFRRVERKTISLHVDLLSWEGLIGRPYGEELFTRNGEPFYVFRPTPLDLAKNVIRKTQIIYPKDLAYISAKLGVHSGSRVIECGSGSGAATTFLASLVRPDGMVYSYEMNKSFLEIAMKNVERFGLSQWVRFKLGKAEDGFDEEGVDAVLLDMAEPWNALRSAYRSLKSGGILASILPTFGQVERMISSLTEMKFTFVEMEEILVRPYKPYPGRIRPDDRMVAHTGYLIFARKFTRKEDIGDEVPETEHIGAEGDSG